jgi:hypothetical protein
MRYAIALLLPFTLTLVAWGQSGTVERRKATLAEQKMCSTQAAKVDAKWRSQWAGSNPAPEVHHYTSHYDPAANVCYVMFYDWYFHKKDNSPSMWLNVVDAFEDRTYGTFMGLSRSGKIEVCKISPPDKVQSDSNDVDCHSEAEFRKRAFKLYGISQ